MKRTYLYIFLLTILSTSFVSSQEINHGSLQIRDSIMDKLLQSSSPDLFKAYHMLFKKEYSLTSPEGILRKKIFLENVEKIKETNAKKLSYTLGINHFADLSKSEFKDKYLTQNTDVKALFEKDNLDYYENFDLDQSAVEMNFDWTNSLGPADQKSCGSCWAFSTTGAIEGNYNIQFPLGKKVEFSAQYLVDCHHIFFNKCNSGGFPLNAFVYINKNGIPYESTYPYKGVDQECNHSPIKNMILTNIEYCWYCSRDNIKRLLSIGPTSAILDASGIMLYKNGIFDGNCSTANHAVVMVGAKIDIFGNGYYILRNSWGQSWGENGYFKVKAGIGKYSCSLEEIVILPRVIKSDYPDPDPPGPPCAKLYSECEHKGIAYDVCFSTPIIPMTKISSFSRGRFRQARFFENENCVLRFDNVFSDNFCFDTSPFRRVIKSIMVGEDETPPNGCIWIYDGFCLTGEKLELCSAVNNLMLVDNQKGWHTKIASIAKGADISYTLRTLNNLSARLTSHSYGLHGSFARNVSTITITKK
jgi:C1A family cysteine protease